MGLKSILVMAAALMLVTVAPEASGGSGTPITACGQVVTTSAFLTQNLTCPVGTDGIVVGASGITIDLKGHTLRSTRAGGQYPRGIFDDGYDSVTIKNGIVSDFDQGIVGNNGTDQMRVSHILAAGNGGGIAIAGDLVRIESTSVYGSATAILVGGDSMLITSTVATGNAYGMQLAGKAIKVVSSTASGNDQYGFYLYPATGAGPSSVKSSTANGNGTDGIGLDFSDGDKLSGNTTIGNGFGVRDHAGLGIYVRLVITPPTGVNMSRGNDNPAECSPAYLC